MKFSEKNVNYNSIKSHKNRASPSLYIITFWEIQRDRCSRRECRFETYDKEIQVRSEPNVLQEIID